MQAYTPVSIAATGHAGSVRGQVLNICRKLCQIDHAQQAQLLLSTSGIVGRLLRLAVAGARPNRSRCAHACLDHRRHAVCAAHLAGPGAVRRTHGHQPAPQTFDGTSSAGMRRARQPAAHLQAPSAPRTCGAQAASPGTLAAGAGPFRAPALLRPVHRNCDCTQRTISPAGNAPEIRATSLPPSKMTMVGMLRMP